MMATLNEALVKITGFAAASLQVSPLPCCAVFHPSDIARPAPSCACFRAVPPLLILFFMYLWPRLQPNSGAAGEYAGLMAIRAYLQVRAQYTLSYVACVLRGVSSCVGCGWLMTTARQLLALLCPLLLCPSCYCNPHRALQPFNVLPAQHFSIRRPAGRATATCA